MKKSISFISGDARQIYLANYFSDIGYTTYTYDISSSLLNDTCTNCDSLDTACNLANYIVFPFRIDYISMLELTSILPFLKDKIVFGGCISPSIEEIFRSNNIIYFDYFKSNYVNKYNSIATAEGCIYYAISNSPLNLHGSKSLVIGYGNCGSVLADKLKKLGSKVAVTCRNSYAQACAYSLSLDYVDISDLAKVIHEYSFIFNTVPSTIINKNVLSNMNKDSIIIDIASSPL